MKKQLEDKKKKHCYNNLSLISGSSEKEQK
jgi:hypothetical protein